MKTKKFNLPVTSREYKLNLNPSKFKNRDKGSEKFCEMLFDLVEQMNGHYSKYIEEHKRITWYLDTKNDNLSKQSYILRMREEENEKKRFKFTIKYGNSDRYISALKKLSTSQESVNKFEEDITPLFISNFSHSTSIKSSSLINLERVKFLLNLFPGLDLVDIKGKKLIIVNDFWAYELSLWIGSFFFEDEIPIKACINFWYNNNKYENKPLVAEFSFDYDIDGKDDSDQLLEKYPEKIITKCELIFGTLQNKKEWISEVSTNKTKTNIAYNMS